MTRYLRLPDQRVRRVERGDDESPRGVHSPSSGLGPYTSYSFTATERHGVKVLDVLPVLFSFRVEDFHATLHISHVSHIVRTGHTPDADAASLVPERLSVCSSTRDTSPSKHPSFPLLYLF